MEGITSKIAVQMGKRGKSESREGVRGMRDTVIEVGLPRTYAHLIEISILVHF